MLVPTRVGSLFVHETGEGEPVVLWPSLLTDHGMWRLQIPALRERYRVIAIDPPGHGRSEPRRDHYSMDDCVGAALEVMDRLGVERARWAGLSWGGMVGMRLAMRHADRIAALALLDTSADRESRRKLPSYLVMLGVARALGVIPPLLARMEPIFFDRTTRRDNRAIIDDFGQRLVRMDRRALVTAVRAVILERDDVRDELSKITAPTLVICGAHDVATPPARSKEIVDRVKGARYVEIPDAGHLSALERPERVTSELLDFFQ